MEYVLAIGNYLNGGTSRGAAHGFQISSLPKVQEFILCLFNRFSGFLLIFPLLYLQLVDTRGSQKHYTLLNLLVDLLSTKEEETLTLGQDLSSIKLAVEGTNKLSSFLSTHCPSLVQGFPLVQWFPLCCNDPLFGFGFSFWSNGPLFLSK